MTMIGRREPSSGRRSPDGGTVASAPAVLRRFTPTAAAVLLLVSVLGVLLLRPGGRSLSNDTEHVERTTVLPQLSSGQVITQPFEARADGLSQVSISFAVGDGVEGCSVRVSVSDAGSVIGERTSECSSLRQAAPWAVSFPPISGSAGHLFEADIELRGTGSAPLTLWGGDSVGTLPHAELDGDDLSVSAVLHTAYGNDRLAVQQLGKALDRIQGYGPPWHHPVVVVTLALLTVVCLIAVVRHPFRAGLALVVAFAVLKGLLWSIVVPPLEGPDERAHVAYAQFMVEQQRLPRRGSDQFGIDRTYSEQLDRALRDVHHQPSSPPGNRADYSTEARDRAENVMAGTGREAGGNGAAAGYSPHYYLPVAALYWLAPGDLDQALGWMRLWSVALGGMAAWMAVLIGRRLFAGAEAAALALGVATAAQPMLSQQTAIVNNDGLVVVAGIACLLIALELAEPAAHRRLVLLGGLAVGLAFTAKPYGIALAPVLVAGWLIGRLRSAPPERRSLPGDVARAGGGVLATFGVWFALSTALNLPLSDFQAANPAPGPRTLRAFLRLHRLDSYNALRERWIDQFWGNFGGLTIPFPGWMRAITTALAIITLIALVVWILVTARRLIAMRTHRLEGEELASTVHIGLCALAILATLAILHGADFMQFRQAGRLELLQGRYALMIVPAALALPVLLARRFVPRLSWSGTVALLASALITLNAVGLALIVERYYL